MVKTSHMDVEFMERFTSPSVLLEKVRENVSNRVSEGKGCRDNFLPEMNSV